MNQSNPTKKAHPAAMLFPLMPADELQKLADDIKANGLLEPIALLDDQILDGRNRLKACEMAGVEPRYEPVHLNGSSPTVYVASKNLLRRHLTQSQRAALGAEMVPLLQEEARKRQRHLGNDNGKHREHRKTLPPNSAGPPNQHKIRGESRQIAGHALQVGKTQIQQAMAVKEADPAEFERIRRGEVSTNAAYKKLHDAAPAKREPHVPKSGKRRDILQKAATDRLVKGLSQIRGLCRGLADLKPELLVLTDADRRAWVKTCSEAAQALYALAKKVKVAA